jgi:hypothetical protein
MQPSVELQGGAVQQQRFMQQPVTNAALLHCCVAVPYLQDEITQDILQDKVFLQGQDKHGRGTCVLQGRKHTLTDSVSQQRYITYVIDGMIAACDPQHNPAAKIVAVFELNGEPGCAG